MPGKRFLAVMNDFRLCPLQPPEEFVQFLSNVFTLPCNGRVDIKSTSSGFDEGRAREPRGCPPLVVRLDAEQLRPSRSRGRVKEYCSTFEAKRLGRGCEQSQ